uniref:39S ribosomal protein L11, mitochondrial-like n=1 Tax=Styela clava TaxID=7725 RepID=UPI00193A5293|nr:39S ribosomal protein L11, mitochondrial-like [Styela clava]
MSKLSRVGKSLQNKVVEKKLPNIIDTVIAANRASTGPPLGPVLGQRGIPIAKFASEFNQQTKHIKTGIPLDTRIYLDGKNFKINISSPTKGYMIFQAAGAKKGERPLNLGQDFIGKITHKHIYEIAKVKIQDEYYTIRDYTMQQMCEEIAQSCYRSHIDIVEKLDPEVYDRYLQTVDEKEAEYQEEKLQKELELKKKMKLS